MPHVGLSFLASASVLWWVGLLLALVAGFWAYYRLLAPLSRAGRMALRALRVSALALVLLALLQPVLTLRSSGSGRPRLTVLLDRSSSMALPGISAETRRDDALAALARLRGRLGARFDFDVAAFSGTLETMTADSAAVASAPLGATALGDALEEIQMRQAESRTGAVILLSDGINTAGKDPALVARNLALPVFGVLVGDTIPPPDLMLREVLVHPVAYAGEPAALRLRLETMGLEAQTVEIRVRELRARGDRLAPASDLARESLDLAAGDGEIETTVEITPSSVGRTLYEIEARGAAAEKVVINNRRWAAIDVRARKTRVLYIEGEPDWDFAFLKRACDADTSLAHTYLVRQKDGGFVRYGAGDPATLPRTAAELAAFAGVILGRLSPEDLPAETVAALKAFVLAGGGVLFLDAPVEGPGTEAWAAAGWDGLLPVAATPDRRWGFALSPCAATLSGLSHELTGLGDSPGATERFWGGLPPVWVREGAHQAAAGAAVLLSARTTHPTKEIPLLAVAPAGSGRVGVFNGRGFWRWDFSTRATSDDAAHAREFWRRVTRWLAEPVQRERLSVSPARMVFQDGEPVVFQARLLDEGLQPLSGARIALRLAPVAGAPDSSGGPRAAARALAAGQAEIALYPEEAAGRYTGAASALPPGMYRYVADATSGHGDERRTWQSEGTFWVEPMGSEFYELAGSMRLLCILAAGSGGTCSRAGETDELAAAIPGDYRRAEVVTQRGIWNHWGLFAFLIAFLSIEWVVRRRKGLA